MMKANLWITKFVNEAWHSKPFLFILFVADTNDDF